MIFKIIFSRKYRCKISKLLRLSITLKVEKKYEEKKATKLGFNSLYEYFEDKILKQKKAREDKERELKLLKNKNKLAKKDIDNKKSCGCC